MGSHDFNAKAVSGANLPWAAFNSPASLFYVVEGEGVTQFGSQTRSTAPSFSNPEQIVGSRTVAYQNNDSRYLVSVFSLANLSLRHLVQNLVITSWYISADSFLFVSLPCDLVQNVFAYKKQGYSLSVTSITSTNSGDWSPESTVIPSTTISGTA